MHHGLFIILLQKTLYDTVFQYVLSNANLSVQTEKLYQVKHNSSKTVLPLFASMALILSFSRAEEQKKWQALDFLYAKPVQVRHAVEESRPLDI